MTKICSKCKKEKPLIEFHKDKSTKDGHMSLCRICKKEYRREYQINNKDKIKEYYTDNRERVKEYYKNNREIILKRTKEYRKNNKDDIKKWKEINKEKIKEYNVKYKKEYGKTNKDKISIYFYKRYHSDQEFNIKKKIRLRIIHALKRQEISKLYKTIELLGCDFAFYKEYIEALFTEGMTWEKLRTGKIHIDHIKPCASFDLREAEQQKACFHYNNTQPLWARDNMFKGAKY